MPHVKGRKEERGPQNGAGKPPPSALYQWRKAQGTYISGRNTQTEALCTSSAQNGRETGRSILVSNEMRSCLKRHVQQGEVKRY